MRFLNLKVRKREIISFILAWLNAAAFQYLTGLSGYTGNYIGAGIYSFMPESLLVFAVCFFLLKRFLTKEILKNRRRMVFSGIFGFLLGFSSVWGQEVLYNTTLFEVSSRVFAAFFAAAGISFFTIPFTSELIGFCDRASIYISEGKKPKGRRLSYFFLIFGIAFMCFVPLFLYVWPMNFFGDSYDELCAQLIGKRSTHHTVIHGLLLRTFYQFGLKHGSPAFGMQFLTILQMVLLAVSIAYFALYLYDKNVPRAVSGFLVCLSILNPVNAYYAVTSEKGTMGIGLAFVGSVLLLRLIGLDREEASKRKWLIYAAAFVLVSASGCLFRNNMIYAFLAGGVVVSFLRKGWKKKILMLSVFLLLFGTYKLEDHLLVRKEGSKTVDRYQEMFSYPIMCLSRIAILHKDEMDPGMYQAITDYIPEYALENYMISSADSVKGDANEELLEEKTKKFLGLFLKGVLKYPGDYLDQLAWLTFGYWEPGHAFALGSTTPVMSSSLPDEFEDIEYKNYLEGKDGFFQFMYGSENGRYKIPLFAWCYRGTVYTWSVLFLLFYGFYKKSRKKISMCMIPLFYLGTVFLGPLCQFRYLYFNVLTLPFILWQIVEQEE